MMSMIGDEAAEAVQPRPRLMALRRAIVSVLATVLAAAGLLAVSTPAAQAATGTYPRRAGVILVTTDPWYTSLGVGFGLGHAAIVHDSNYVVESLKSGVQWGYNNWYSARNTVTAVSVSQTTAAQDNTAAVWSARQIGKPYNYNFYDRNTRAKFYCSQLVWASFWDNFRIDLDTWRWGVAVAPTELTQNGKVYQIYKK